MSGVEQLDQSEDHYSGVSVAAVLAPTLVSVICAFGALSMIAYLITTKKCCRRKPEDPEELRLKSRLLLAKQKMMKTRMNFLEHNRPIFNCVLQQEDNEVAEEVKEHYITISADISRPFACCPNSAASFSYIPSKALHEGSKPVTELPAAMGDVSEDSLDVPISMSAGLSKAAFLTPELLKESDITISNDNGRINVNNLSPAARASHETTSKSVGCMLTKRILSERDLEQPDNVKDILFSNWLEQVHEAQVSSAKLNHSYSSSEAVTENLLPYDEVGSILTSISRMDGKRRALLQNTPFYKQVASRVPSKTASVACTGVEKVEDVDIAPDKDASKVSVLTSESLFRVVPPTSRQVLTLSEKQPPIQSEIETLGDSTLTPSIRGHREDCGNYYLYNSTEASHLESLEANRSHAKIESSINVTPTRPLYLPLVNRASDYNHNQIVRKSRKNVSFATSNLSSIHAAAARNLSKEEDVTINTTRSSAHTCWREISEGQSRASSSHPDATTREESTASSSHSDRLSDASSSRRSAVSSRKVPIPLDDGKHVPGKSGRIDFLNRDQFPRRPKGNAMTSFDELSLSSDSLSDFSMSCTESRNRSLRRNNSEPHSFPHENQNKTATMLQWTPQHLTKNYK